MFKKFLRNLADARQSYANREVARMLKAEFPGESLDHIEYMISNGRLDEMRG